MGTSPSITRAGTARCCWGHNRPAVIEAVERQLRRGTHVGAWSVYGSSSESHIFSSPNNEAITPADIDAGKYRLPHLQGPVATRPAPKN